MFLLHRFHPTNKWDGSRVVASPAIKGVESVRVLQIYSSFESESTKARNHKNFALIYFVSALHKFQPFRQPTGSLVLQCTAANHTS